MTRQSEAAFRRAREVLVGGVNSPVRSFSAVGGTPRINAPPPPTTHTHHNPNHNQENKIR